MPQATRRAQQANRAGQQKCPQQRKRYELVPVRGRRDLAVRLPLMGQRYTTSFHEIASLRDGRQVVLRLVRPADAAVLKAGVERLSPESRYRPFHAVRLELGNDERGY